MWYIGSVFTGQGVAETVFTGRRRQNDIRMVKTTIKIAKNYFFAVVYCPHKARSRKTSKAERGAFFSPDTMPEGEPERLRLFDKS